MQGLPQDHNDLAFWKTRAKRYDRLQWATKSDYLDAFLTAGDFHAEDVVLDVGTGTAIIAKALAPRVRRVVGIDASPEMLKHGREKQTPNEEFRVMDVRKIDFPDGSFTKVTARMVFHHVLEEIEEAMGECFRVLAPGGRMIFSEGVPPSEHVKPWYTEMFKLKEERNTFMDEDLRRLMERAGFQNIQEKIHWARQSSIRNWLQNSGLAQPVQDQIFQMHLDLDERGKRDYNMTQVDHDCLIDMKFVILTGDKG